MLGWISLFLLKKNKSHYVSDFKIYLFLEKKERIFHLLIYSYVGGKKLLAFYQYGVHCSFLFCFVVVFKHNILILKAFLSNPSLLSIFIARRC